jgi:glycosyltransferase involved in cell wall biosynthesis
MLLIPALFSSDGGIERMLRLYLRAAGELAGAGETVSAVVLNDHTIPAERLAPYRTPALARVLPCGRNKLAFAWHTLRLARQSRRIVCGHVHLLRLALLARRFTPGLEIWLVAHGIEVWRPFNPAEQSALRAADRILCVSEYTRRQLLAQCPGLAPARLVVQPNALDPQFDAGPPGESRVEPGLVLSVCRLDAAEAYKGVDHLIAALPAIRTAVPGARLRVVGDGSDRPRLEALARTLGMAGAVDFAGRVGDAELRASFAACQLFALPSRAEGFGLVYLEALAQGKPCIAANAGGAPEVVDATCGALVEYGDIAALSRACITALQAHWDPALLRARADEFSYAGFRERLAAAW